MLLRKEPETTWRIWGVSGDMDLLRCSYRDRTFRWVHPRFLIRQTAYRWAELQGKPAGDIEQIRTSKTEETVHKGGISMSMAGLSLAVYRSSSKVLWSASFVYASLRGQDWRWKDLTQKRKAELARLATNLSPSTQEQCCRTLLWQKLKVSIVFDINWLSRILLVQQRFCSRQILYGDHQWTLLEVITAWCLQDHCEEIGYFKWDKIHKIWNNLYC